MSGNFVGGEDGSNAVDEPRTHQDGARGAQPQLGQVRESRISGLEIKLEEMDWVEVRGAFFEYDSGPFEEAVGLMHWEEEGAVGPGIGVKLHA